MMYKENGKLVETTRITRPRKHADVVVSDPNGKVRETFTAVTQRRAHTC
jgi:hypothetical protein